MFARLAILFITTTLTELYLLLRLNEWTGSAITTIGLILFTGCLGAWLTKQQGLSTVMKIQKAMSEGRMPATELVDAGMILFAGALLLTPGILTDAFGFSLLMPPCRAVYRRLLKKMFPAANMKFHVQGSGFPHAPQDEFENDPSVVEGQATPTKESSD